MSGYDEGWFRGRVHYLETENVTLRRQLESAQHNLQDAVRATGFGSSSELALARLTAQQALADRSRAEYLDQFRRAIVGWAEDARLVLAQGRLPHDVLVSLVKAIDAGNARYLKKNFAAEAAATITAQRDRVAAAERQHHLDQRRRLPIEVLVTGGAS